MEMERIFDRYIKFNKQEGNEVGIKVLRSHKALLTNFLFGEVSSTSNQIDPDNHDQI